MTEVLLLGSSIPALVAALELCEVGVQVRFAEAPEPQPTNVPQRPVRDHDGVVAALLAELETSFTPGREPERTIDVVRHEPSQAKLMNHAGEWKPQPFPSVFGIPTTVPITTECADMLGTGGTFRAYLDRLKPLLTIGKQEDFAKLVDSRIGKTARELLVDPMIRDRFGVATGDVEVSVVAHGLNEALTRAGSLTGSAFQLLERHVARETTLEPVAGWEAIAKLLRERIELLGATRFPGVPASLTRVPEADGVASGNAASDDAPVGGWIVTDEAGASHSFAAIIVDGPIDSNIATAGSAGVGDALETILPTRSRMYAEIGIQAPSSGAAAELADALAVVTDTAGVHWTARVTRDGSLPEGGWTLICASEAMDSSGLPVPDELGDLPGLLGLRQRPGTVHTWVEAAPIVTREAQDARAAQLEGWHNEWPDVLACSEQFVGGELGPAIADARSRAVRLRRQLTGIAD